MDGFNTKFISMNDKMLIPTVGFGTWQIADTDATKIVEEALESGYRLIDTAAIYKNENGVGTALKNTSIKREEIFLATKVWNTDQGYDATLRAMDSSLSKLKTDYLDLYMIHWPAPKQDKYLPSWKALMRLNKEGLAKSIGVCNFNQEQIERLINEAGVVPAVNQIEIHPHFQQRELRSLHEKHNIISEAWSPLARGKIFDNELIVSIGKKYNKTTAQVILRWHFENGIVAIPKSSNQKRILENLDIFDFNLTQEDLKNLLTIDNKNGRTGPDPDTADF